MHFINFKPSWKSVLLLVLLAPTLYLFPLPEVPELRLVDEGLNANFTQQMISGQGWLQTRLYGHPVPGFPLYPWLAALCSGHLPFLSGKGVAPQTPDVATAEQCAVPAVGQEKPVEQVDEKPIEQLLDNHHGDGKADWLDRILRLLAETLRATPESTLRLPSILSLWGLALVCGLFARRVQSGFAGLMAAAIVLTSLVCLLIGVRAQSETVTALILAMAWFWWFNRGWKQKRWWSAWGVSFALVFIATLGVGIKAILIFYLPLCFLPGPFGIYEQLQSPAHVVTMIAFMGMLTIWLLMVPGQPFMTWNAIAFLEPPQTWGRYATHLVSMFPKAALYLLPWSLIAWAPFCLALRRFEQDSEACRFLRTIVIVNALLVWVLPGGSPLHLIPILGPMAVLIGIHAEIVFRRYLDVWNWMLKLVGWLAALCACATIVFWGCARAGVIAQPPQATRLSAAALLLAVIALILLLSENLFSKRRRSLHSSLLWTILACRFLYLATMLGPRAAMLSDRRDHGRMLAEKLPDTPPATIYMLWPEQETIGLTLVETFYLHTCIRHIKDAAQDIPSQEGTVYLLSPQVPAAPNRKWKAVSPKVRLDDRHQLCFLHENILDHLGNGEFPLASLERIPYEKQPPYTMAELRLYQGERIELPEP
ncbi:MAG: hypothetical protein IJJ33_03920 [Victivallales bacterium]|nr:hypothetical protein [Victivallales bacterium]